MEVQVALLEWINTFTLAEDVKSLSELSDGHILWDILRDVDPTYFTSNLPEGRSNTTKWISRYENLKFIHITLISYITEACGQEPFARHAGEGLQAVAQDAPTAAPELVELCQLVLQATIYSPRKDEHIPKMTSLTPSSLQILKELIQGKQVTEYTNSQQENGGLTPPTFTADPELEFEERFGEVMAENERLLQENKDLQGEKRGWLDRLVRLQDNNDALQQRLTEVEDALKQDGSDRSSKENDFIKDLESRLYQQESDFADQETRLAEQTRKNEALHKKIRNLEASLDSSGRGARDAHDELDQVRKERDILTKKANTADKFKQQLQTSMGLKKENDSLRIEIDDVRKDAEASQQLRRENIGLTTAVNEYKQLLPRIEEDNAELVRIRRQLELDIEGLHKQHKQDKATIAQLNRRVRSSSVSSVGSHDNNDLEDEFSELSDKQTKAQQRTSNVEKQNKQLESIAQEQASKIVTLQRLLNEANNRPKPQNDVRRQSFTSSVSTERPGSAQRFGVPTMNGEAQPAHSLISLDTFTKLRAQLDTEEVKRKKVDTQLRETILELDLAKKDRRHLIYLYMNVDEQHSNHLAVSYVAMDKLEMVAQIKEDNSTDLKKLQEEHNLLQEVHDRVESENREQKDLISKAMGRNASMVENAESMQEIKDLISGIKAGKPQEPSLNDVVIFGEMIMEGRKVLVETQKVCQEKAFPVVESQPTAFPSILAKRSAPPATTLSWFKKSKATA
ncbi:MAG: hypothetical protein Q9170_006141 [Blastenia crenularia]